MSSDEPGDSETTNVATRHPYTNDVLAGLVILSNVALLGAGAYFELGVPDVLWKTFALAVGLAATWAFGRGALKDLLSAIKGGNGGGQS
ncbi:hypothetical protein [Halobacterium noricense]|uniref:hypothetical protein n=1 Tax=Halobacterium noricense TaxID=223182 RepID=UPI001E603DA8|nr:hypothetical protein [Halobacterium noricense]UHH26462.1 hypothetical protein LT974_05870 [Halobacterium noricense]